MTKKALVKKLDPVEAFLSAQFVAGEAAMGVFHDAVRRGMPKLIEDAIASVASDAFAGGVEWANNTPMSRRERKLIA